MSLVCLIIYKLVRCGCCEQKTASTGCCSVTRVQIVRTTAAFSCAKFWVLSRRVSQVTLLQCCGSLQRSLKMGKKRRAFDDADESEEDEISRHAEAAWLARRRAQQPPAAAPPPPPGGPGPRTQGKGKPPKKKRKKPEPPAEAAAPDQPKRSKSARKRAAAAAARERKAKAVKAEKKAKRKEKWRQEGIKNKKAAGGRVHRQTEKHGESRWGKKDGEDAPKPSARDKKS